MSDFPIIVGIIGKKLYLTILLALIYSLEGIFQHLIYQKNDIPLIDNLGGSLLEMLSIFIPCIFKFKSKSETSIKICTKVILKDYSIL